MRSSVVLAVAFLIAAPLMGAKPAKKAGREVPVPDSALGLSRTSVFATPAPPPVIMNSRDPGEGLVLPRMFPGAPPQIPHGIADFVPIKVGESMCLDCHDREMAADVGATPLPLSHYRDLRRAPTVERTTVAGARYLCVSCHVPVTRSAAALARPRDSQK